MYIVYKHTSPCNKVYIGITSQSPEKRWQNGRGYIKNNHFWNAIQKYGWDNFKHEILYDNLTKEEACQKEIELIALYNSNNREYGYNISLGGETNSTHYVTMYSFNGEKIKTYQTTHDAELETNISCESIIACANGKTYSAGGYIWKYDDNDLELNDLNNFKTTKDNRLLDIRKFNYYNIIIYKYSLKGKLLKVYNSVYDIPNISIKEQENIIRCAKLEIKSSKGYTYRFHRDYELEKTGINRKPLSSLYKAIKQYDLNGNLIKEFSSINEATKLTKIKNINLCLVGKRITAGGFVWRYDKDDFDKYSVVKKQPSPPKKYENIPVYQYNISGELINTYPSIYDIPKEFGAIGNIQKCLIGEIKSVGAYIYSFDKYDKIKYERKHNNKKVYQYTTDLKFIAEYNSVAEAERKTGLKNISRCARGERKTIGGYVWTYEKTK